MFYNTGIATYIWVLTNRKPTHRKGKVQLIDATSWFKPLRKNLGKKNCELTEEDIDRITQSFVEFKKSEQSKIFENAEFGYWKVTVERPLRLHSQLTRKAIESLRFASGDSDLRAKLYNKFGEQLFEDFAKIRSKVETWLADDNVEEDDDESEEAIKKKAIPEKKKKKLIDAETWKRDAKLVDAASQLRGKLGDKLFSNHDVFRAEVDEALSAVGLRLSAAEKKLLFRAVSWRVDEAPPVIRRIHKSGKADPLRGLFEATINGKRRVVEYEPDTDLRDTEQVPLREPGGIDAFIKREVLPYAPDSRFDGDATKIGYEISFNRYFYKPQPLRSLEEIKTDILSVERETEGMLKEIVGSSI
jgi:type I restriction enzyme M protein